MKRHKAAALPKSQAARATLALLETMPWEALTLEVIAKRAKLPLSTLKKACPDKTALIPAIVGLIDERVALSYAKDPASSVQERVFDVFMTRFESLQAFRPGVLALASRCRREPDLAFSMFKAQKKSLDLMRRLLSLKGQERIGPVSILALLFILQKAFCRWENDASADLASTMAALDIAIKTCGKLGFLPSQEGHTS